MRDLLALLAGLLGDERKLEHDLGDACRPRRANWMNLTPPKSLPLSLKRPLPRPPAWTWALSTTGRRRTGRRLAAPRRATARRCRAAPRPRRRPAVLSPDIRGSSSGFPRKVEQRSRYISGSAGRQVPKPAAPARVVRAARAPAPLDRAFCCSTRSCDRPIPRMWYIGPAAQTGRSNDESLALQLRLALGAASASRPAVRAWAQAPATASPPPLPLAAPGPARAGACRRTLNPSSRWRRRRRIIRGRSSMCMTPCTATAWAALPRSTPWAAPAWARS